MQTFTLVVAPAAQTIDFPAIDAHAFGDADFDPGATASSGLAVAYATDGACSIVDGNLPHHRHRHLCCHGVAGRKCRLRRCHRSDSELHHQSRGGNHHARCRLPAPALHRREPADRNGHHRSIRDRLHRDLRRIQHHRPTDAGSYTVVATISTRTMLARRPTR